MKKLFLILSILPLTACGTFTTLSSTDREIAASLKKEKSYCESIPRVYSGLSYNFCKMHSASESINADLLLGIYLVDGVMSTATDTVALPFTIYGQYKNGDISLKNHQY
ncbi:YceK/YidQ family lipoprotein [Microbulbifer sp. GL-2]|uniref:YceK/YidQ family lipoprotein n=1 Tax=Microbulbifer sp. GL-2 TaxID=2591606 RepID=UPI00117DBA74|nr:YceK/YidQ family lipoprotein [Microbulbifer sp. GL-2]